MTTEPSPEFIGMMVLGLAFLSRWLWDYNRERREAAAEHEPRADPALHVTYATKLEHNALAKKIDEELGRERGARKKIHEEISELQAGVATLDEKTDSQTEQLGQLKDQIERAGERIDLVPQRTITLLRETQQFHKAR